MGALGGLGIFLAVVGLVFFLADATGTDICKAAFGGFGSSGFDIARAGAGLTCSGITGLITALSVPFMAIGLLLAIVGGT